MTTPARITGAVNLALSRQVRAVGIAFERLAAPLDLELERLVGETGAGGDPTPPAPPHLLLETGGALLLESGGLLLLE